MKSIKNMSNFSAEEGLVKILNRQNQPNSSICDNGFAFFSHMTKKSLKCFFKILLCFSSWDNNTVNDDPIKWIHSWDYPKYQSFFIVILFDNLRNLIWWALDLSLFFAWVLSPSLKRFSSGLLLSRIISDKPVSKINLNNGTKLSI